MTTKDGEIMPAHVVPSVEGEINEGDEFFLVDEAGEKIDTPAGDYEYSGMIISVDEEGIISAIVPVEESEESEEMAAAKEEENFDEKLYSKLSELIDEFKSLREEFEDVKKENESLKASFDKFSKAPSEKNTLSNVKFSDVNTQKLKSPLHALLKS